MPMSLRPPATALAEKIRRLQGPILVLGASGFVGANLMRPLLAAAQDVYGTTTRKPAWRLEDLPRRPRPDGRPADRLEPRRPARRRPPRTVFDCVAYGAYSFETDSQLIYRTNFNFLTRLLRAAASRGRSPATSTPAAPRSTATTPPGPTEDDPAGAQQRLRRLQGRRRQPDPLLRQAQEASLRQPAALLGLRPARGLVAADPQRDPPRRWRATYPDVRQPGDLARFRLRGRRDRGVRRHRAEPDRRPTSASRSTSAPAARPRSARSPRRPASCSASPASRRSPCPTAPGTSRTGTPTSTRPASRLGWQPRDRASATACSATVDWYRALPDKATYHQSSKKFGLDTVYSVSAIIACYKDNQAIPIMYERLKATFTKLNIDFEIIFVNDCSPDDTEEVIRAISRERPPRDRHHATRGTSARSRRSAAAWRSPRRTPASCSTATCRTRPS